MRVSDILQRKGRHIESATPDEMLRSAAQRLHERKIGALVVRSDDGELEGVLSERDIISAIAVNGIVALSRPIREIIDKRGPTCVSQDSIESVMALMTETRRRHIPVFDDDQLVGIVSIGDVVKQRLTELEQETKSLHEYVTGSR